MTVLTRECCFSDFSIAIDDARGIGHSRTGPFAGQTASCGCVRSFCFVFGVDGGAGVGFNNSGYHV